MRNFTILGQKDHKFSGKRNIDIEDDDDNDDDDDDDDDDDYTISIQSVIKCYPSISLQLRLLEQSQDNKKVI